jgi:hypothetical protein
MDSRCSGTRRTFVGQVERDSNGVLWAILYAAPAERTQFPLTREMVHSMRQGRRRVTDMVLAEADAADELAGAAS